ncbi:glycosyltransferase family 4 protein [Paracraurococcus lichenis]|uniref:Glycosyltransferase family 4 protein n=1 Tax=Paracraurococcus lichenis TaxID=3064888 RepID=A0ABT9E713_9PROT|nr:glycosyltransferase family 4 protein [Paracraurococcus sp. LOR1-02]MDO9711735.1 glycosyltransferase family 4 protein [Paracraurococcus sp. LOR1-02]
MSARRILFLNNQGLGAIGGGVSILRALTADLARDHDVVLATEDPPGGAGFAEHQLPRFAPPRGGAWRFKPWLKARHLLRALDPALVRWADVVVALDPHFAPALAAARPRRLIHLSLSCATRQEWFGNPGSTAWWYAAQYALLERRLARQASAVVVASALHAREMARFAGLRGRPVQVFAPVFPVTAASTSPNWRRGLVAVGRITPVKNLPALIPLLRRLPETRLALVGEGDELAPLRRLAREAGIADRIDWVGAVDDPTPWIDRAALLLHPSRYESFGMVVQEAMRRGTVPVVFAQGRGRRNAAAELVTHGESGLLVDYDDPDATAAAIRALLDDPARLAAMSARARNVAAQRDRFDYAARFRDLLARLGQTA